jgi:hypothetical protein
MPLFYASLAASRQQQLQTRGRADRYSFLVGLFHPLLRTGLSRRSLDRLFHDSNGDVPRSVCLRRAVPCSTSRSALQCDGTPDPGMDDATASGSVSMGPSTEIPAARSRCDLRLTVRRHHERHGCGRSGNGTASALAKSICLTQSANPPKCSESVSRQNAVWVQQHSGRVHQDEGAFPLKEAKRRQVQLSTR